MLYIIICIVYPHLHMNMYTILKVREERKAVRDSRRHLEKMAVGRHIGDRGHVMQKSRNMKTNEMEQHQDLFGINES